MTSGKRSSLFAIPSGEPPGEPAPQAAVEKVRKYPVSKSREGKRVVTAYLEPEAHKQLARICLDEDTDIQGLLREGINDVFAKRGLTRMA